MTDQLYDERDDEQESAHGETEEHEEGKPYGADDLAPETTEDESNPDF